MAAQQLEILGMKTAEFRVISGTRLMSMVHTGVMYNVQYEFGWAPVELPKKVREWRDQARVQEEAGQSSAPAGAKSQKAPVPERQEEAGQQSAPAKKDWDEADITEEDVEMAIEVEEQRTKKEWLETVRKHEGQKVSNKHTHAPSSLAHEDTILREAYERHEREMLELDHIHHGIRRVLECKNKDQCKDRNCGFRHGDQPAGKGSFKQWIKDQNIIKNKAKVSPNTYPPPPLLLPPYANKYMGREEDYRQIQVTRERRRTRRDLCPCGYSRGPIQEENA